MLACGRPLALQVSQELIRDGMNMDNCQDHNLDPGSRARVEDSKAQKARSLPGLGNNKGIVKSPKSRLQLHITTVDRSRRASGFEYGGKSDLITTGCSSSRCLLNGTNPPPNVVKLPILCWSTPRLLKNSDTVCTVLRTPPIMIIQGMSSRSKSCGYAQATHHASLSDLRPFRLLD
jgi:hypothetical protein